MILIKIIGGLGNQMFQYAAGKALALHHKTSLKVDTTSFSEQQLRDFDLFNLHVDATIASTEEIKSLRAFNTGQRIQSYFQSYPRRKFYKQRYFHFDKKFFRLGPNVYLQGYFQSEKFFNTVSEDIRREFMIKKEKLVNVEKFAEQLRKHNSVAIHVRRGDYKTEKILKVHGILPLSYYENAIARMRSQYPDVSFYVFTDDPNWVNENLHLEEVHFVSGKISSTHFEDLYLMSTCSHNIIANSSFSWWSAWLNPNKNKTVIAPAKWFNKGPGDIQDLIPEDWIKL